VDNAKPKKQGEVHDQVAENDAIGGPGPPEEEGDVTDQASMPLSPSGNTPLRLQDAGEGAQPLRLLNCGHVFHVSRPYLRVICVDDY
jgi:hypothetical protein